MKTTNQTFENMENLPEVIAKSVENRNNLAENVEEEEEEEEEEEMEEFEDDDEEDFEDFEQNQDELEALQIEHSNQNGKPRPLYESMTKGRISVKDYPFKAKTYEKVLFLCQQNPGFWCIREIQTMIERIEGKESEITLKSFRQTVHYWSHQKKLVSVKFGNNKLVFYGLRSWVIEGSNGAWKIKDGMEPKNQFLRGNSYADLRQDKVSWRGLKRES